MGIRFVGGGGRNSQLFVLRKCLWLVFRNVLAVNSVVFHLLPLVVVILHEDEDDDEDNEVGYHIVIIIINYYSDVSDLM